MYQDIQPGNLSRIHSDGLREVAAQALEAGRSVRLYVCPAIPELYGFVETLVVDGTRAAQASDMNPVVWWSRWDAGSETLYSDTEGWRVGLRGELLDVRTGDAGQPPVSPARDTEEPARPLVSRSRITEEELRALVSRARNLEELLLAVRQDVSFFDILDDEQRRRLLPTFGNSEPPWNLEYVWSWSPYEVLVRMPGGDGPELVSRQHWER